jgi:hypothetical protein
MDDIQIAKKEILELFESFINNSSNKALQKKAMELEKRFASLTTINDYSNKKIVPESLILAISLLQKIYQFGDKVFEDEKTLVEIEKLKKKLK